MILAGDIGGRKTVIAHYQESGRAHAEVGVIRREVTEIRPSASR